MESFADAVNAHCVAGRGLRVFEDCVTTSFASTRLHNLQRQASRLNHMRTFARDTKKLAQKAPSGFSSLRGESRREFVLRLDENYQCWCEEWNDGLDKPTIASNLFMKNTESYRCCHYGVKRGNTWLMDIEGCHWICGYKFVGKQNYVTEACHRVDTLFGGKELTPEELEWR